MNDVDRLLRHTFRSTLDQPPPGALARVRSRALRGTAGPARHRGARWFMLPAVAVAVTAVAISATLVLSLASPAIDSRVGRDDILDGIQAPTDDDHGMNFLLLGSDSRESQENQPFDETGQRSDMIMIVHINQAKTGAFIVSIPRDSYVDIPPSPGRWDGGPNKLNAALAFGGANLAARTIYNLTKLPVNGAMLVNFEGVSNMVNAVGGVDVCPPYNVPNFFTDDYPQYAGWSAGRCYEMKGEEAMVFLRQRHDLPGGDFGRIRSQQLVLKALAQKAPSSGILLNPVKLDVSYRPGPRPSRSTKTRTCASSCSRSRGSARTTSNSPPRPQRA
jgi:LCP family protein required for cell wall assembly